MPTASRNVLSLPARLTAAVLSLAFALTGCGGGGGGSSVSPGAAAPGALSATVSVTIPSTNATTASAGRSLFSVLRSAVNSTRKPQYLTSYTQGIDLQAVQGGVASGYVFYPLSALQSYCTTVATGYSCNLKVMVPPGLSQLVVNTYDGTTKAGSNVLSTATLSISASAASSNAFSVTTLPVVAGINAFNGSQIQCPTLGTPLTVSSPYTTTDADNGTLSGTLGSPFSAANSDLTGSVLFSPGPFTTATGTFTMTYNGGTPTNGVAVINGISSTINSKGVANGSVGNGSVTPIPATPAGPHYLYFVDSAANTVSQYDVCQNSVTKTISLPAGTNPVYVRYDDINTSPPRVVVAGANNTLVYVDINSSTNLYTVSLPGTPHHIIESSTGKILVTVDPNKVYRYNINPSGPTYLGSVASMTVGNGPIGLNFVGPSPNPIFYVVNSTDGTVSVASISTMTETASRISIGGTIKGVGGNDTSTANATCMLVPNEANNTVTSIDPTTNAVANTASVAGSPVYLTSFPNTASTLNTGIVAFQNGSAQLVTCSGATVSAGPTWSVFPTNPTTMTSSRILAGTAFVAGQYNGQGVIQAYNSGQDIPLWSNSVGSTTISSMSSGL